MSACNYNYFPIHSCIEQGTIDDLRDVLDQGAYNSVNNLDYKGDSPLIVAVCLDNIPAVKLLLYYMADIQTKDDTGTTPLHLAASRGNAEMMELLLENGADVDECDDFDNTPLHYARDNIDIIKLLLENGADPNIRNNFDEPPFFDACRGQNMDIIQVFIENGADVSMENSNGEKCYEFLSDANKNIFFEKYFFEHKEPDV